MTALDIAQVNQHSDVYDELKPLYAKQPPITMVCCLLLVVFFLTYKMKTETLLLFLIGKTEGTKKESSKVIGTQTIARAGQEDEMEIRTKRNEHSS